jgi:hypothetical protein
MPTIRPRRFSNVDLLAKLKESDLRSLLSRHAGYFERYQIRVEGPLDLERLASLLVAPNEEPPGALVDALFLIEEMSSASAFEELVKAVRRDSALSSSIDLEAELTPLDLAIRVYLAAPEVLEREHRRRVRLGLPVFATPSGAQWEELVIRFRDGETVSVALRSLRAVLTYSQLGMAKQSNAAPTAQWGLLRAFADGRGTLDWRAPTASRRNQKRRERLARDLVRFFRIEGDPIAYTGNGWRCRFVIEPEGA